MVFTDTSPTRWVKEFISFPKLFVRQFNESELVRLDFIHQSKRYEISGSVSLIH